MAAIGKFMEAATRDIQKEFCEGSERGEDSLGNSGTGRELGQPPFRESRSWPCYSLGASPLTSVFELPPTSLLVLGRIKGVWDPRKQSRSLGIMWNLREKKFICPCIPLEQTGVLTRMLLINN